MSFTFFLARRFYRAAGSDRSRRASSLAIRIATIGVAVGLAVMIVSVGVVKGFQQEIKSTVTGFASHIEVLHPASFTSPESYPVRADTALLSAARRVNGVTRVQRVSQKMGILKTEDAYQTILLKGIDREYDTAFLRRRIICGALPSFGTDSTVNSIVISSRQAAALHLEVGSRVYAYFVNDDIRLRRFTVSGVYETNLSQYDEHIVWADRSAVNTLNAWGADSCSSVEVTLDDFRAIPAVQSALTRLIAAHRPSGGAPEADPVAMSVAENPRSQAILQWIDLLDMNVWIILGLMGGVAGFTMISGLLILILERTRTIGVLKALGAGNSRIRHIFMAYATLIGVRGLFWGNILGVGLLLLQRYFSLVKLDPVTYYVSTVPVDLNVWPIILMNILTLVLIFSALIVPSFLISRIQPARSIKYE